MVKIPTKKAAKGFEETLWDTANQLRGCVESAEYKHVVLSLVFLKFISDKFESKRKQLIKSGQENFLEMDVFYQQDNVFFLPEEARWAYVKARAKQDDLAVLIDTALATIEKRNPALAGALPDNYFSRLGLEAIRLSSLVDIIENIDTLANECHLTEEDLVGRVYEYFLGRFAATEGKGGGEFYTPKSVVTLLAEMLEPYQGKIYDPCCGSGGMFVQSIKFVESHKGKSQDITIYGQEMTSTTYKLAKMNLAVRGLSGNLGERPADTFFADQHPDLKADFIMANPPFNLKDWRKEEELTNDPRFDGFRTPPTGNANYGWILHILSKLSEDGVAGVVLANSSMSSNSRGEGEIRQQLLEDDRIECIISLPSQLFYTTQISVCLWFISKNKQASLKYGYRDRSGETLFIDAQNLGSMISRSQKELTTDDIKTIADTFHAWRCNDSQLKRRIKANKISIAQYQDQVGFCKAVSLTEIKTNDYILTPGRYVGAVNIEADDIDFETKINGLTQTLYHQLNKNIELDKSIRISMEALGYGE
ncbi:type I restriction-modification system subunit M [Aeromonas veronii]|uniref:type I restriction-modification system subunit M n=1 Tax=Aeromonas veronii TaxID=654 RepID=UPI0018F15BC5|nr:class I SAM-dependent DNA methyltransferase [Aeromonas veronii]MBJ7583699.1 N-6 DNA methylase [Aeromonas veronii]HEH9410823.1 N-6 DNA methylase [Aeromonas salmonicida]